jgi:phage terminase large subunit-like protein
VLIFEQDNEQELKDERTWQKSNPSLHDVVPIDYLRELYTTACNFPSQYSSIMTKNFNVWVQGKSNPFIEEKYLQSAMSDDVQFSKKFVSYCGVDLASSNDLS